ncbi:MAG: Ig-like domain-containing protein [Muribaculaceae bacterium]|nr:Ig-like domain-containing protein [Muribaculaceae bacterium]
MKKFLLSLAAVALATSAYAESALVTFSNLGYANAEDITTVDTKDSNISIVCDKGTSNNHPKYYNTGTGMRMYSGNTMTVTAASGYEITNIAFKASGTSYVIKASVNTGTYTTDNTVNSSWTGNATEVVFTTSNTSRTQTIEVTYAATVPVGKEPAGLAFPASSFSVGMGQDFTKGTLENPNKLNVTWASSDEAVATVDQEGFVVVKGIGTTIISADSEETETYAAGHAQYSLTVVPAATTLPQMLQAAPKQGDKVLVIGELYVIYANGQYVYVKDMFDNAGLLYGTNNYTAGDVIPGEWEATNAIYNDVLEWSGSFPGAAANDPNYVTYETVQSVTAADLNKVVLIKGVQFPDGTPAAKAGVTVTLPDGTEILVHNQFSLEEMPAGTYNLVAAVTIYKGAVQLYAIEYQTASAVEPTFPESLNITTNAEGLIIEQGWKSDGYNVKITGESPEAVLVNFETPEGYDGIFIMGDVEVDDSVSPFRAAEAAEWMPLSYFQSYGSMGNTVELPLSKYSDYFDIYLVWNDMVDYANSITVTYKITEANTDGVEVIEAAEAEAEYYTLQGVKVTNPTEGIYVKVANGKATKVVL